jgi:hypothetical protein
MPVEGTAFYTRHPRNQAGWYVPPPSKPSGPVVDISDGPTLPPNGPPSRLVSAGHGGISLTQPLHAPHQWPSRPRTKNDAASGQDPRQGYDNFLVEVRYAPGGARKLTTQQFEDEFGEGWKKQWKIARPAGYRDGGKAGGKSIDWPALSKRLPTGRDATSTAQRRKLFDRFDMNGNGRLSLAEVDKAVRDVVKSPPLFNAKPVVMRAFAAARRANVASPRRAGGDGSVDYVERDEFRMLLFCLRFYFELFAIFARLDTSDDRRLDIEEWRAGVAVLAQHGVRVDDADDEFRRIDVNGGGKVLFDEFCEWAIDRKLSAGEGSGGAPPTPRDSGAPPGGGAVLAAAPPRPPAQPLTRPPIAYAAKPPKLRENRDPAAAKFSPVEWRPASGATANASDKERQRRFEVQNKLNAVARAAHEGFARAQSHAAKEAARPSPPPITERDPKLRGLVVREQALERKLAQGLRLAPVEGAALAKELADVREQIDRLRRLRDINQKAKLKAQTAPSREAAEERRWSQLQGKAAPAMSLQSASGSPCLAHQISLVRNLTTRFKQWDKDGSGCIDRAEFGHALKSLGVRSVGGTLPSKEEVDTLFATFDRDGNGRLHYSELESMLLEDEARAAAWPPPLGSDISTSTSEAVGRMAELYPTKRDPALDTRPDRVRSDLARSHYLARKQELEAKLQAGGLTATEQHATVAELARINGGLPPPKQGVRVSREVKPHDGLWKSR